MAMTQRDPFSEYVAGMRSRFGGPQPAASTSAGASKPSSFGGSQVLTEPGTPNYLGEKTGGIKLTGAADTGDVMAGPGALPSPSAGVGAGGPLGGAARGRALGPGGPSDLALALQSLGTAKNVGEFLSNFLNRGEGATRGNVGGPDQPQGSNQSLSDQLRSTGGLEAAGPGVLDIANEIRRAIGAPQFTGTFTDPRFPNTQFPTTGPVEGLAELAPEVASSLQSLSSATGIPVAQLGAMSPQQLGDVLMGGTVAPGVSGATGAASGLTGGLGLAGGGAGAAAAILGLIASLTGDPTLGKAAQALGAAASAAGTTAAVSGAITGATTGVLGAAGAAFAPIAAMMLASTISGLAGGEDPVGEGINEMITSADRYQTFVPELMQNVGRQGTAFSTLQRALPYVQSKEELGQLLNTYKNYLGTTTGITPEQWGGTGEGDVYSIGKIPGVGPRTHGQATPPIDFGPQTQALQSQIEAMLGVLPGERITAAYGQPGGGLEGEAARRLWQQFLLTAPPADTSASLYVPGFDMPGISGGPGMTYGTEGNVAGGYTGTPVYEAAGSPYKTYNPIDIFRGQEAGTVSRTPTWDPATGEWVLTRGTAPPKPSDYFQVSPYWRQLIGQQQGFAAEQGAQSAQRSQLAQAVLDSFTRAPFGGMAEGHTQADRFGPTGGISAPMLAAAQDEERRRRAAV